MNKENMVKLRYGMYIVRTQAGFKKAVKDFSEGDKYEVRGYPICYPSFVTLYLGYTGATFIGVNFIHINSLIKALEGHKVQQSPCEQ